MKSATWMWIPLSLIIFFSVLSPSRLCAESVDSLNPSGKVQHVVGRSAGRSGIQLRIVDPAPRLAAQDSRPVPPPSPIQLVTSEVSDEIRLIQAQNSELDELLREITNEAAQDAAPPQVREPLQPLVQEVEDSTATDELDGLLRQTKDMIDKEEAVRKLPAGASLETAAQAEAEAEAARTRLRGQLNRLLPEEEDVNPPAEPAKEKANEDSVDYPVGRLIDPQPQPVYRPHQRNNQPFTLSGILTEDDRVDPQCEAEFCRRVWECAGGRHQGHFQRCLREWRRNQDILWNRGGSKPCNPMANFGPCPMVPADNCQCNHGGLGGGYYTLRSPDGQFIEMHQVDSNPIESDRQPLMSMPTEPAQLETLPRF